MSLIHVVIIILIGITETESKDLNANFFHSIGLQNLYFHIEFFQNRKLHFNLTYHMQISI